MSFSSNVNPEQTANMSKNQPITGTNAMVNKEPLVNVSDGNVDEMSRSIKQETIDIGSSTVYNLDNRITELNHSNGGSSNQTLKMNAQQTVAASKWEIPVIKTEPIDNVVSNCDKSGTPGLRLVAEYDDTDDDESMDTTNSKVEKVKDVKVIKEVVKKEEVHISSSETDSSSSDSSDLESSSSGVDESEEEAEQRGKSKGKKGQETRQRETTAMPEKLPTVVYRELIIPEEVELEELGYVNSIIGQLVVIQSHQGTPALNMDSVLFKENKQAIGAVYDVFGPVVSPLYSVVFNDAADITAQNITLKMLVYFAPHIKDVTAYVFTDKLRRDKGSDASWKNDEEPPAECVEFSDDEKEKEAKHNKKQEGKEGRRRKKPQRRDNQEFRGGNERSQQQKSHRRQWPRNRPPHQDNQGGPPFEGNHGQFADNSFHHNHGHQPSFGEMGHQFPPRLPAPGGHYHPPPPPLPPPPPQGHIFPPRGFMGDGPPVGPFDNGPPNMGFGNQGPSPTEGGNFGPAHWKEEPHFGNPLGPPFGPPPVPMERPQGPPFPNGNFGPRPMNPMFDNFSGMWQPPPPPPPPPNVNFGPSGLHGPPGQNMPPGMRMPPPGFPLPPLPPPPPP